VHVAAIAEKARNEFAQSLAARLMTMLGEGVSVSNPSSLPALPAAPAPVSPAPAAANGAKAPSDGVAAAPWIESAMCTSCNECISINNRIFAYDADKHAYIKDARGGPYKDLVRAAEKCTAQVIHPGTPRDPKEKDRDKLLKRAAKYN